MPVTIKGLDALRRNIDKVGAQTETVIIERAVILGSEVLQGSMSMRAPVRTGRLAGAIEVEVQRRVRRGAVVTRIGPSREGFYAKFIEFGTRFMAAQPFMRPAIDEDGPRAVTLMQDVVRQQTERIPMAK